MGISCCLFLFSPAPGVGVGDNRATDLAQDCRMAPMLPGTVAAHTVVGGGVVRKCDGCYWDGADCTPEEVGCTIHTEEGPKEGWPLYADEVPQYEEPKFGRNGGL